MRLDLLLALSASASHASRPAQIWRLKSRTPSDAGGMFDGDGRKVELGNWATAEVRVALLGDSTLDNILYVGSEPCIAEQLAALAPCAVRNLAADGYDSTDELRGSKAVESVEGRAAVGDPVPFSQDRVFRPLNELDRLFPPPTHVVISVGGNDMRDVLGNIGELRAARANFTRNYPAIVEACLRVTPNVTLMWQYRPAFDQDEDGGVYETIGALPGPGEAVDKLNDLIETSYQPMLELARKHNLPVVDLANTFDIHDSELFINQIEPSTKGGAVISFLLRHVIFNHQADTPSTFYKLVPCEPDVKNVVGEVNDGQHWAIEIASGE